VRGGSLFRTDVVGLETGFALTADAAPGSTLTLLDPHVPAAPELRAGNPTAAALSPDGRTLVVLTSGFNLTYDERGKEMSEGSQQWAFVYDVTAGAPRETDVLPIPNTFGGLAWDPRGHRFWVSGGPDDAVYEIARERDAWRRLPPIPLGHLDEKQRGGRGLDMGPYAAGIAANASGTLLAVANHENDSLTIVDAVTRAKVREVPLWPGGGARGGGYPFDVVFVGDELAYATSQRDREVVEVDAVAGSVTRRIRVRGQPVRVVSDREGERLFVANANADTVSVIDRARGLVEDEIATTAPDAVAFRGSSPNAIALSPNESMLYVTNGGNNTLAVISLARRRTIGLVPTGFYPHAVAVSRDGGWLYVAHGKSPAGPNPFGPWSDAARAKQKYDAPGLHNQFSLQLQMGGLLSFPRPAPADLEKLTLQSLANNRIGVRSPTPNLDALAGKIKHVVYVLAENRTYDQILGDLPGADGEPLLVHWGERITPNQHALAREFVTFDRFFVSGGVSGDGWQWSTCARTTDVTEKVLPLQYARRGRHSYDWEGTNRNVNVAIPTTARRRALNPDSPDDDDVLPGVADVAAPDGPEEGGTGFLWDAALRAGLSVRNYGFFLDYWRYNRGEDHPARIPTLRMPFESRTRVAIPARASLERVTDPYFRGFDMRFPDFWRFKEWEREFDEQVARGEMPALSLVRLPHDHLGSFHDALDGLDTPDTQMADHDYALGLLVEKIARSPFWKDTVIVAMEDDAQNGSDHVDAHRSLIFFAGAHVKRGAVISTPHTTPDVLRTIELLLGLPPLAQQDAFARPIDEVFTTDASLKPFQAIVPSVLRTTKLPLPPAPEGETADRPRGDAATWALVTRGMDFNRTDAAPAAELNRALWCGLVDATGCTSSAAFASIDED
jgi:YVTN family beta-propeller protein